MQLNFLYVVFSYALRLGAGMAVFVIIARFLGPEMFGEFTYWLSIATILCMVVNFGFGTMVLKSFGDNSSGASSMMSAVFTAKLILTMAVCLTTLLSLFFVIQDTQSRTYFCLLLLAQVAESFTEFYNLGFRVRGQYQHEASLSSATSLVHIVVMLSTLFAVHSLLAVCVAFACSRLLGLWLTAMYIAHVWQGVRPGSIKDGLTVIKSGWSYALEIKLSTLYTQLDAVIIFNLLGATTLGIYQAGMKLVLGVCRLSPVLAQLVLPKVSYAYTHSPKAAGLLFIKTFLGFCVIGLLAMLVMTMFADWITMTLFGAKFVALSQWLPVFGAILWLRFMETGAGLIVVAKNLQAQKVFFVFIQLLAMITLGYLAIKYHGLAGWLGVNVGALVFVLAAYFYLIKKCSIRNGSV